MEHDDEHQRALIASVASGDDASFDALYDCFSRPLFALGLKSFRHDSGKAEELVQETMVKVWRAATSYDPGKGRPSAWIFTIARRTAIDLARKSARTPVPVDSGSDSADVAASEREQWRDWEIGVLLGMLPLEQRTAIEMFVIEGYTHVEVAASLDVPVGTIKSRIYKGLRHLRDRVEGLELLETSS